jgi:hypothetical protein
MDSVLGLLGLIVYVVCVIAIAAGITWLVVRITPTGKKKEAETPAQ